MSSIQEQEEEQEAGPIGIFCEETLALLGLDMSDSEQEEHLSCREVMEDSDDEVCNDVLDRFERQRDFQTQILQQSGGGGLDPQTPVGAFEFDLEPFVNRQSSRMGVRKRHFNTRLRQTGNFVDSPHVVQALQDGLRRAMDPVLTFTPNLHDQERLYVTLSSNRLTSNFQGWRLRTGEWREGGARLDALFNRLAQALNSNQQFEMDDSFQLSITQVHHAPRGTGKPRPLKPGHQTLQIFKQKKDASFASETGMFCAVRGPWSAPKPRWTNTLNEDPFKKEETPKRTSFAPPRGSPRPSRSMLVRRVNPIQCRPLPLRVPDLPSGCRPYLPCEYFWTTLVQTTHPTPRERSL